MFRILILVAGFLIAVTGMLWMQGNRDPRDLAAIAPDLADVEIENVAQMSATTTRPTPAPAPVDIAALTDAVRASVAPDPVAEPATAATADEGLAALTSSVLASLGTPAPAAPLTGDSGMEAATAAVLASLNGMAAPTARPPQDLNALIAQSMRAGESDAYMDALLNEAVASGAVQVPDSLITAEGRVDTRTLLASIVQQSMGTAEDATIQAIAAEAGATTDATPVVQEVSGERIYTVESGDSLAYIALVFYRDAAQYERIYEANRDVLASPSLIRVGQKLRIPG
ncbi:LysM peptidoglycan-binding domain-containing protein [uncultured Maritimibacter sp.]|uniref:LysM peptidoglycan-binding domain-containing protein n=1 Tax=uncultured Maritimibacter sp. TaxID=991866 RepID=UPI002592B945|nr:LysM peptidoglycan-binding domain-containing protein [uncultured Maritimibacter sp.]